MKKKNKILVTGAAGFIGTNFTEKALTLGFDILAIDVFTYSGLKNNIVRFKNYNKFKFKKINIIDKNKIIKLLKDFKPTHIINFAAESHVDRSIDNPTIFIETNTLGVVNLLQSIKNADLINDTTFIQISTDEVYGDVTSQANENNRYFPNSPYSASKASADLFIRSWTKTYGIKSLILHPSNNYGPRQFPEKLIPLAITNALNKNKIRIYGNGNQVREWIFVEDTVDAILACLENSKASGHINVGSGKRISNLELVQKICLILENENIKNKFKYSKLIYFTEDRPGHDQKYAISSKKAKLVLNWKAKVNIDSGLRKTIRWYIKNKDWWTKIKNSIYDGKRLGLKK